MSSHKAFVRIPITSRPSPLSATHHRIYVRSSFTVLFFRWGHSKKRIRSICRPKTNPFIPPLQYFQSKHTTNTATMTIAKSLEPYVCGGTAATFGSCCIHPIDLAKVCISCISPSFSWSTWRILPQQWQSQILPVDTYKAFSSRYFSISSPMILINIVTTIDPVEMNKWNLLFCLTNEKLHW